MTSKYHIYEDTDDGRPVYLVLERGTNDCVDNYDNRTDAERALHTLNVNHDHEFEKDCEYIVKA